MAFDGEGARVFGGRWNHRWTPVVYTSATLSLAVMELLVHLDDEDGGKDYAGIPAAACETAVLAVPSAIIPQELDYLLNPRHPPFTRIRAGRPEPFFFDPRLRKR